MFVPPGELMQGVWHTKDEDDDADERELDALEVLDDDTEVTDELEDRDDEDAELADDDDAPEELAEELEADESDELLLESPVPLPGRKTSLPALPHAEITRVTAISDTSKRIFIGVTFKINGQLMYRPVLKFANCLVRETQRSDAADVRHAPNERH